MPKDDVEDDEEKTELDDTSQFKITVHKSPQTIDELCENIKGNVGMTCFKYIKYDTLETIDKENIEEAVLDMMATSKYTPLEFGNLVPNELYKKIDEIWKYELKTKRQIREGALAIVIPDLSRKEISKETSIIVNLCQSVEKFLFLSTMQKMQLKIVKLFGRNYMDLCLMMKRRMKLSKLSLKWLNQIKPKDFNDDTIPQGDKHIEKITIEDDNPTKDTTQEDNMTNEPKNKDKLIELEQKEEAPQIKSTHETFMDPNLLIIQVKDYPKVDTQEITQQVHLALFIPNFPIFLVNIVNNKGNENVGKFEQQRLQANKGENTQVPEQRNSAIEGNINVDIVGEKKYDQENKYSIGERSHASRPQHEGDKEEG